MADTAKFEIEIMQIMRGQSAVTELQKTESALKASMGAVSRYEREYTKAMAAVDKAGRKIADQEKTVEKAKGTKEYGPELAALNNMYRKQSDLKQAAVAAGSALDAEKNKARGLAKELQELSEAENGAASGAQKLGGEIGHLRAPTGQASKELSQVGGKLREMGGPMAQFAGMGVVGGVVALAYGFVQLAKAIASAAVELTKFAFESAMAESRQKLLLGSLLKNNEAGERLSATFREIQRATGVGTDDLTEWTRQLKDAKLKTASLDAALKGLALQKAATGNANVAKLLEDLKAGKTTAAKFAEEMDKLYGKNVAEGMKGLDKQWEEAKRKVADIFAKVDLGPLQDAVAKLFALLDKPEVVAALQKAFQWVVDTLTSAVQWVTEFMDGLKSPEAQMALVMIEGVLQVIGANLKFIGFLVDLALIPFRLIAEVAAAIANALSDAAKAAKNLTSGMPGGGTGAFGAGFGADGASLPWKAAFGGEAANDNAEDGGSNLGKGFANGIRSAIGDAVSAAQEMARAARQAVETELDEHSPSRVAHRLGEFFGQGMAEGIEDSTAGVSAATARMVSIPQVRPAGESARGRAPVTIQALNINGVKGAEEIPERVRDAVIRILEGTATEAAAA